MATLTQTACGPMIERRPIHILVVDDSVVIRKAIGELLRAQNVEVDVAPNGKIGLAKLRLQRPDAVILDLDMPVMNGLEALTIYREIYPDLPIIVCSTLTARGATETLQALARGATAYLTKPTTYRRDQPPKKQLQSDLLPLINEICRPEIPAPIQSNRHISDNPSATPSIVAIGASTGGPRALDTLLNSLPTSFCVPMVIAQHMPPLFTQILANRLASTTGRNIFEVTQTTKLTAGMVCIAPGDYHLEVARDEDSVVVKPVQGPLENGSRPAVDVLFRSVAKVYNDQALAVVLTGMGRDGLRGAQCIKENGGRVFAQDRATSVVWGMPRHIHDAGLADAILPLDQLGETIALVCEEKPLAVS